MLLYLFYLCTSQLGNLAAMASILCSAAASLVTAEQLQSLNSERDSLKSLNSELQDLFKDASRSVSRRELL